MIVQNSGGSTTVHNVISPSEAHTVSHYTVHVRVQVFTPSIQPTQLLYVPGQLYVLM